MVAKTGAFRKPRNWGGAGEAEGRSVLHLGGKPSAQLLADQTFSITVDAGSLLGLFVVQ